MGNLNAASSAADIAAFVAALGPEFEGDSWQALDYCLDGSVVFNAKSFDELQSFMASNVPCLPKRISRLRELHAQAKAVNAITEFRSRYFSPDSSVEEWMRLSDSFSPLRCSSAPIPLGSTALRQMQGPQYPLADPSKLPPRAPLPPIAVIKQHSDGWAEEAPPSVEERIPCLCCHRHFSSSAAERHIPKCKAAGTKWSSMQGDVISASIRGLRPDTFLFAIGAIALPRRW